MPVVCVNRPNRSAPRHFTAAAAARIWCYAKAAGATEATFLALVRERQCWDDPLDRREWLKRVQDILDALELIIEFVLSWLIEPRVRILKFFWNILPARVRLWLERKAARLINDLEDLRERIKALPPPPI